MKLFRPLLLFCLSAALAFSAFAFVPLVGSVAVAQGIVPPPDLVTPAVVADMFKIALLAMLASAICLLVVRIISRLRSTPDPMPFDGGFQNAWRLTDPDPGRRR